MGRVAERLLAVPPREIALPAVVLFELETGIARSTQPAKRRHQLDELTRLVPVLPFGAEEARLAARIRGQREARGLPVGPFDLLIAATALAHGATLVTRNTREFDRVKGLRIVDWY